MHLIVRNKAIVTPMMTILKTLQSEMTNGKLRAIDSERRSNIPVCCPSHKDGFEAHPSCMIFSDINDKETEYGFAHCFTCGYAAPLPKFIADCFDEPDIEFGEEWLLARCETAFVSQVDYLPPIEIDSKQIIKPKIDESILNNYRYYHDYMWYRGLSKEVVDYFEVGYDPSKDMITFPVRDENRNLVFITGRYVNQRRFEIPKDVIKPVYLLYHIREQGLTNICICESQINTLYMWSLGIPAVGLFGTGTPYQYDLLKKSGIRVFNLFFDGDEAGIKGAIRFKRNMPDDIIVNEYRLPQGKDVNNLTYDEIVKLPCF